MNLKTQKPVLTDSVLAAVDLQAQRFVGVDGNLVAAGEQVFAVVDADTAAGNMAPGNVLGILLVEVGAAVAAGAELQSDADSRAITKAAGKVAGIALDAASSAGDVIRMVRGI